jgi:hypothetical protein
MKPPHLLSLVGAKREEWGLCLQLFADWVLEFNFPDDDSCGLSFSSLS